MGEWDMAEQATVVGDLLAEWLGRCSICRCDAAVSIGAGITVCRRASCEFDALYGHGVDRLSPIGATAEGTR